MKQRPRFDVTSLNFIRQSQPIYRRLLLLLGAAFALMLVTNTGILYMVRQTSAYTEIELKGHQTQIEGWRLISLLTDAETGQRGFMLTARPDYLHVYNNALEQLPGVLEGLDKLVADDPDLSARLERIKALYEHRRRLMVDTVEMTRSGRIGEAVGAIRSGQGKALMDGMRQEVSAMSASIDRRTDAATNAARWAQRMSLILSIVSGLLMVLLGVIGAGLVRRQIHDLLKAQNQLDRINSGLEEEVRVRTADLVRANEEIQRFAYIVSHDLRAPLVNVMGYTSELEQIAGNVRTLLARLDEEHPGLVNDETRLGILEDAPEAIGFIRASTTKMDGLIKAILQLSRDGRRDLNPQPLDMQQMLQGLVDAVAHPLAENDGQVVIGELPGITHDRMAVEQIFGNLIDNAIKYQDPEQSLLLQIKGRELDGNMVEFEITDNGRGIAPKDHERIFELFRRSGRQDRPGEGLGLAFVRSSVRRLGGKITVTSDLGKGTTFRVHLPKHQPVRVA